MSEDDERNIENMKEAILRANEEQRREDFKARLSWAVTIVIVIAILTCVFCIVLAIASSSHPH
jgi:peptidoglycan biosynthesis protein MviN/MurJ (putative lipid II flippase)